MPKIVKGEETLQQTVPSENTFSAEENAMNAVAQDQNVQMPSAPAGMIATPTIVNDKVPVVAFVGPPSSGKSMILVRLAKYLRERVKNCVTHGKDCVVITMGAGDIDRQVKHIAKALQI